MTNHSPIDAMETLKATFSGQILTPDDGGYDEVRRVHNGLIDKHPAAIARCQVTPDVVDAVNFAREHDLEISVRGPDHLSTHAAFLHAPDGSGTQLCAVAACHAGEDQQRAEADLRGLRSFGTPAADLVQRMPYPTINTLLDGLFPRGALNYWKSAFVPELTDAVVDAATQALANAPTDMCLLVFERFHGAVTRVDPTATAYPHRQPGHNFLLISQWTDPEQTEQGIAWARETFDTLRPYMADRAYVNYMDADDDDRLHHAYGPNYQRLAQLKNTYDPGNVFHHNHNIAPSHEPTTATGYQTS